MDLQVSFSSWNRCSTCGGLDMRHVTRPVELLRLPGRQADRGGRQVGWTQGTAAANRREPSGHLPLSRQDVQPPKFPSWEASDSQQQATRNEANQQRNQQGFPVSSAVVSSSPITNGAFLRLLLCCCRGQGPERDEDLSTSLHLARPPHLSHSPAALTITPHTLVFLRVLLQSLNHPLQAQRLFFLLFLLPPFRILLLSSIFLEPTPKITTAALYISPSAAHHFHPPTLTHLPNSPFLYSSAFRQRQFHLNSCRRFPF